MFKKRHIPWNKGKHIWQNKSHHMLGRKHTKESKRKLSETRKRLFQLGILKGPMKGRYHSEETKLKISLAKIGKPNPKASETKKKLFAEGKLVPWNKGKKHSEETKRKISIKCKELWKNPEFRKKVIENSLRGLKKRPTSLERKMIELIEKHRLPFRFAGDGSFLIGFKNPDFIATVNKKICIEVANRIHHNDVWAKNRIEHFSKFGWKCLIIWWNEIFLDKWGLNTRPNWETNILEKINDFIIFS